MIQKEILMIIMVKVSRQSNMEHGNGCFILKVWNQHKTECANQDEENGEDKKDNVKDNHVEGKAYNYYCLPIWRETWCSSISILSHFMWTSMNIHFKQRNLMLSHTYFKRFHANINEYTL